MITYDEISGLMYISLKHQKDDKNIVVKSMVIDDNFIVDYDELTERVIGIEITDPERTSYLYEAIQDFTKGNK